MLNNKLARSLIIFLANLMAMERLALCQLAPNSSSLITNEQVAAVWLQHYNLLASDVAYDAIEASWNYATNLTDYNQNLSVITSVRRATFLKEASRNTTFFAWRNFSDVKLRRQFAMLAEIGKSALSDADVREVKSIEGNLQKIYSTAELCDNPKQPSKCFSLDPHLTNLYVTSHDWDELKWAWQRWRDATGRKMKKQYSRMVELLNKAAVLNGFGDMGELWRSPYEMPDFEAACERLWQQVKPLYEQLHAYVRRQLLKLYSNHGHMFADSGHIPAHLLGNMWAQAWHFPESLLTPYPSRHSPNITKILVDKKYNASAMFRLAEEFFMSLGLRPMTQSFWDKSMLVKPQDRAVVCHASAWDFMKNNDFRIKQCTEVTLAWLLTTHHEMGHIQYAMEYSHQPITFKDGANPGFHEAIGDVISLSVTTPEHLHEIGLLQSLTNDTEDDINFLMSQALKKIAFLPFGYLIDLWRWDVFRGHIRPDNYNSNWWKLRCKYQGISPPVARSEEDFDPGAKFHIPNNTPYIRYFVSYIIQFQFHKALCAAAGNTAPLHRCDIYRSRAAGEKLRALLSAGSSEPWQDVMYNMTGQREMDAGAVLEYFQPLYDWLKERNKGHPMGWTDECPDDSFHSNASIAKPRLLSLALLLVILHIITANVFTIYR